MSEDTEYTAAYQYLVDAVTEHLAPCVKDGEEAEEYLIAEAIRRAGAVVNAALAWATCTSTNFNRATDVLLDAVQDLNGAPPFTAGTLTGDDDGSDAYALRFAAAWITDDFDTLVAEDQAAARRLCRVLERVAHCAASRAASPLPRPFTPGAV